MRSLSFSLRTVVMTVLMYQDMRQSFSQIHKRCSVLCALLESRSRFITMKSSQIHPPFVFLRSVRLTLPCLQRWCCGDRRRKGILIWAKWNQAKDRWRNDYDLHGDSCYSIHWDVIMREIICSQPLIVRVSLINSSSIWIVLKRASIQKLVQTAEYNLRRIIIRSSNRKDNKRPPLDQFSFHHFINVSFGD